MTDITALFAGITGEDIANAMVEAFRGNEVTISLSLRDAQGNDATLSHTMRLPDISAEDILRQRMFHQHRWRDEE